jgi:predicted transposase YdaD
VLEWLSCDQDTLRLYELREKALHDEVTRMEGTYEKAKLEGRAEGEAKGKLEGRAEGEAKGKLEGRTEGEAKGKLEVAMNLLAEGLEIPLVAKTTGLPEAEIQKLIEKNERSRPGE